MEHEDARNSVSSGMTRRSFLARLVGILSAPLAVFIGWPMIHSLIGPIYRLKKPHFVKVGEVKKLPKREPVAINFELPAEGGYIHSNVVHTIWAIKHSDNDVTVLSPICPHLGCHYDWYPDAKKFICPCHGSVFSMTGEVLAGPAPRSLDTLPTNIENGELYIQWELFEVGIPKKRVIG